MRLDITKLDHKLSVSGQISIDDITEIAAAGYRSIICNRPDYEGGENQPGSEELEATAKLLDITFVYLPIRIGSIPTERAEAFQKLMVELPKPVLAFCGSGMRATALYGMTKQNDQNDPEAQESVVAACNWDNAFDVVVIGGGSAGIGVTASLLKRRPMLRIAIIEPSGKHYYQPAWTLVGAGAYDIAETVKPMTDILPKNAQWIQAAASGFDPEHNRVHLSDGRVMGYRQLIVCPGIRLAWEKIEGLEETLGKNGVTSNYQYDLAPYTWSLVKELKAGKAIFTQPPMPIKCAGAPQKAMYLSCDHWMRAQCLENMDVEFNTATAVLFGVADFVPPLMDYVRRYHAKLVFNSNLVKVDGNKKIAYFENKGNDGTVTLEEKPFDMLHVTPSQVAPDFLHNSPLADASGFCKVNEKTLQHTDYSNIFSLGDACSSPNTKTAAAARKQIVVVAENLLAAKEDRELTTIYDGYGACPLTVENGKVILAEFGFGGKLLPTFPLDPTVPRKLNWFLKTTVFPWIYWNGMLKGKEWLARPGKLS
ncbi:bifunctional protein tyrosine phosphatase family protein/NAD(P)/FAD-dependent oxidoreductase [Nitrosomonas sp.]|uniref:bifunctional protein tyrosine phosphatase family protein/NAD(P)/FAD-dependent oxidoreductase n=1 Tax=Nitrosomonas sp. TaxID=42353 RepID=UPI0025FD8C9F|nr:bifunctional protein tyrosine phosphatase family protein/NAD(P)/FAD-dependent oxidoreductase [Nitrosomonas sp.]MBY0485504.1 bifunctional protein tyrosine phosphatase family protein/NAD(P)/FAD-dependent oxidoreductase [Nitrosomonas sp.]